jgi:tetratricopeptide (TPR) repeat protein
LAVQRGSVETARTILTLGVELKPTDLRLWETLMNYEKKLGNHQEYLRVLQRAAQNCGSSEKIILKLAKEEIRNANVSKAKNILSQAISTEPNNEGLIMALLEVHKNMKEFDGCRSLLKEFISKRPSIALWRYGIKLERDVGNLNQALERCLEATKSYPYDIDIACDLSLVYEEMSKFEKARDNYTSLIKNPKCWGASRPWIQLINLEEKLSGPSKVPRANKGKNHLRAVQEARAQGPGNVAPNYTNGTAVRKLPSASTAARRSHFRVSKRRRVVGAGYRERAEREATQEGLHGHGHLRQQRLHYERHREDILARSEEGKGHLLVRDGSHRSSHQRRHLGVHSLHLDTIITFCWNQVPSPKPLRFSKDAPTLSLLRADYGPRYPPSLRTGIRLSNRSLKSFWRT